MNTAFAVALVASLGSMVGTASAAPPSATLPVSEPAPEPAAAPELSVGRLFGELMVGSLVGGAGMVGGAFLGYSIEMRDGCHSEFCGLGGVIVGGFLGYTLTAPAGVYMAGSSGNETGSLGWTYGGSLIGGGIGIMLAATGSEGGALLGLAAPLIGSMIGFNATRRYKQDAGPRRMWTPTATVSSQQSTFGIAGRF